MTLGSYLKAASALGWESGHNDCCTFPANWVCRFAGGDPMAEWRGLYSSDDEARALIDRAGGLAALWARGLTSIGWRQTHAPQEGDVGVIVAIGAARQPEHVGAIWTGRRWAFRAPAGIIVASADVIGAWTHV